MKKIFNLTTIISTGVLNFIKAADGDNISEKNISVFIDGTEYKFKEGDNENVNINDSESVGEFLKKRTNIETFKDHEVALSIYDLYIESSIDGTNYTEVDWSNFKFLKYNFFKKNEVDKNKLKINDTNFTEEKIKSLEYLKMILKNLEKEVKGKLKNFRSAPFRKLENIYIYLNKNKIVKPNELIVSYKIDGDETKINDFITIDNLEKIYDAISQKKSVDIVSKKIDINYYFDGQYSFNNKEFTEEQFNKLNNLNNILNLKYISFNSLTEKEVINYLKDQYGIDGNVIFKSNEYDENVKCITLPDKYLLCRVNLSLKADEIEDKTLKYNYLNQLELNSLKIYPKGIKYSELEKYINDQFNFLKGKKYTLFDDENNEINNNNEIIQGDVTIYIDNDEVNNDLYEKINDNIKNVNIFIYGKCYSFYLKDVKNKNILDLIKNILDKCYNKKIGDLDIKFLNHENVEIEIKDNEDELNKEFYTFENNNISIKVAIKEKGKKKDDKDKGGDHTNSEGGAGKSTEGDGQGAGGDGTKEKNKGCSGY